MYGEFDLQFDEYILSKSIIMEEKALVWRDSMHYSARQKTAMELGGSMGSFKMKGVFSNFEISLLELAKIAGAGKNTNFGLGQLDYWIR